MVGKENVKNNNKKRNEYSSKNRPRLIRCPVCGKEISSEAELCINCGHPISKQKVSVSNTKNQLKCPTCGSNS
jgi:DNA-directed RNA polymerase subunit RPC12/RpoP